LLCVNAFAITQTRQLSERFRLASIDNMTKIDRYLLFLYSRVFLICFLTLSGLLIVVQVFTNLDEMIAYGKVRGSFALGLAEYFSPYMLSIYDRMCGLLTLLATMFVIAWLYRTHEMTALLAAGISKGRIVKPMLIMSAILILLSAVSRELIIPEYSAMLSKTPQELLGESIRPIRPTEDLEKGVLIAGNNLQPANLLINKPIFRFLGPASSLTPQITGSSATFCDADNLHPRGYLVSEAKSAEPLAGKASIKNEDEIFLLLPTDTDWLKPNQCFVPSQLEFDVLRGGGAKQFASTSDLIWRMQHQSHYYGGDLTVAVHTRLIQPLLDFTQLLLGIPMILSNRNRNLVSMILSCVVSFAAFFGISIALHALGANDTLLSPATAAWAPLLIFGPYAWSQARHAMQS
jgi:lipopolysaccharide export system permease protein